MSHRFFCYYKYRLNGNEDGLLLYKDRANEAFCYCRLPRNTNRINIRFSITYTSNIAKHCCITFTIIIIF